MTLQILQVAGSQALGELDRLRQLAAGRGHQAFLIGDPEEGRQFEEQVASSDEVANSLRLIGAFDRTEWLRDRRTEMDEDGWEIEKNLLGTWAGENPRKGGLSLHRDYKGNELKTVALGEVDVKESWQIPAALNYGGWNECPDDVVQGAMFKHWGECYGAEILALSHDTIECRVTRPPRNPKEAMELAWEQFLFCEDIVTQGVDTINALAAILLNSPHWFFWWD